MNKTENEQPIKENICNNDNIHLLIFKNINTSYKSIWKSNAQGNIAKDRKGQYAKGEIQVVTKTCCKM